MKMKHQKFKNADLRVNHTHHVISRETHEIRVIESLKGGDTECIKTQAVLPHLVTGAQSICDQMQKDFDEKALPIRVYLFRGNVPVYAGLAEYV